MKTPKGRFASGLLPAALLTLGLCGHAYAGLSVGATPPDELGRQGNTTIRLSDDAGKVRVITFWASWCPPCRRELPVLAQIQAQIGTDHLQIYAVNYKEDRRTYRKLARKLKELSAMVFLHDRTGRLGGQYGVDGLPHMIIIDRSGAVAHIHRGYADSVLDTLVEELNALLTSQP